MTTESRESFKVRFPPSPTGPLHVGGARTALFNWLFARKHGGTFLFRIEDSDEERSKPEYEEQIIEGLLWLGLTWDEGLGKTDGKWKQSERTEDYHKYLQKLLEEGWAYYCYCTKEELEAQKTAMVTEGLSPKYSGHCRHLTEPPPGKEPQVIRFKNPGGEVEFKDLIRGNIKTNTDALGDFVIAKSIDRTPLYNFAVTIDDYEMDITHVIRGEDHISNTPKQILLQKALNIASPQYAHLPLVLNPDRSKLSKRYADVSVLNYRDKGILPEALINFLVLLGWHSQGDKEVFNLNELVQEFDIKRVQKSGAIFNEEKLLWLNGEHLKRLTNEELFTILAPILQEKGVKEDENFVLRVVGVVRERMKTLNDFWEFASFFFKISDYDKELLKWQDDDISKTRDILEKTKVKLKGLTAEAPQEAILEALDDLISEFGRGSVLWPLRAAVSGRSASPDPISIVKVLGVGESIKRIDAAIHKLK